VGASLSPRARTCVVQWIQQVVCVHEG